MEVVDAYTQGFRARREGLTIHQNPFATFTMQQSDWQRGWQAMDEHLGDRDDALDSIGWHGATPCK